MMMTTKFIDTSGESDPSPEIDAAFVEVQNLIPGEVKQVLLTPHSARVYTGYDEGSNREYYETVNGLLLTVVYDGE